MMRYLLFIFLLEAPFLGKAQNKILYYSEPPADFAIAKISKQALEKDMQWWQLTMEESHVNLYHAMTKAALQQLQKELLRELPDSVTHAQASFAISRLIGSLNEAHLGFATNAVIDSVYSYEAIRFPYLIAGVDDRAFIVERDLSSLNKLPPFSRIVEVNNTPVQQLYDKYSKFYGGLEAWKKLQVKGQIRKLLFMDGIRSPFKIKAVILNDTLEFTVNGFTRKQADSLSKTLAVSGSSVPPFSLRFLNDTIAHIEFNSMDGGLKDSFAFFLQHSFTEIRKRKIKGIIIDLRKNGGGDSGLGDMMLDYINSKPYRNMSSVKIRISKHSKAYANLRGIDDSFKNKGNGELYEYKVKNLMQPKKNPIRFTGKVAVLIGTGTFSSANMLANAIKDYGLATLIGESTAEPANDFGEIFSFMLPHTHIVAAGAFKMFTRANGNEKDFDGIKPDIEVKNSLADVEAKRDRVMGKAVEWVKE
ncbi:MAG TPA: S41 family peptidase [Flavisolibacter sp.]|nr:S41 family peptidase [Flavisolibacter sp.]